MRDPGRIWDAALGELRLGMSQANFESYLAGTEATAFEDDELTIQVHESTGPRDARTAVPPAHPARPLSTWSAAVPGAIRLGGRANGRPSKRRRRLRHVRAAAEREARTGSSRRTDDGSGRRTLEPPTLAGWEGSPLNERYTFESFVVGSAEPAGPRRLAGRRRCARSGVQPTLPVRRRRPGQDAPASRHRPRSLAARHERGLRLVRDIHQRLDRVDPRAPQRGVPRATTAGAIS